MEYFLQNFGEMISKYQIFVSRSWLQMKEWATNINEVFTLIKMQKDITMKMNNFISNSMD